MVPSFLSLTRYAPLDGSHYEPIIIKGIGTLSRFVIYILDLKLHKKAFDSRVYVGKCTWKRTELVVNAKKGHAGSQINTSSKYICPFIQGTIDYLSSGVSLKSNLCNRLQSNVTSIFRCKNLQAGSKEFIVLPARACYLNFGINSCELEINRAKSIHLYS